MESEITIVLADQDLIFLERCKVYLKKTGTRILFCQSGEEALEIIRNVRPNLVFMSPLLHGISGLECCGTVKADPSLRGIPIALTLTAGLPVNLETCLQAGCDEIVLKPIDRHAFFKIVKKFVAFEKINAPRFRSRLCVHFSHPDFSKVAAEALDISTGGLFLGFDTPLPVSSAIDVHFVLPATSIRITCAARVTWVNPPARPIKPDLPAGMGVQFLDMPPVCENALREFIHNELIVRTA